MKLKKGIMLHMGDLPIHDAVLINSGVVPHSTVEKNKVSFAPYSFVPSFVEDAVLPERNWRGLTDEELELLRPTEERNDSNTVYIGDVPPYLKELFGRMQLEECRNRGEVLSKFKLSPDGLAELNRELDVFLRGKANGRAFQFHYLGSNLPNLEVVACDTTRMPTDHREEEKMYMGVHNDGTKYVPIQMLYKSGNRLTINLGKESRYFLFVNLTLTQAFNMLKKKMDDKRPKIDVINIASLFFEHFPDYPVIRVEQKPYQYYIAPTDNCFHDGSTLGTKELDIIMVYFGSFCY